MAERDARFISREDELSLIRRAQAGDLAARDELFEAHDSYIHHCARKWWKQGRRGYEYDDCVQVATLGMMRALEKFDCEKPYSFLTYATWWIRQRLSCLTEQESVVVVHRGQGRTNAYRDYAKRARLSASLSSPVGDGDCTLGDLVLGQNDDGHNKLLERDEHDYHKHVIETLLRVVPQRYREIAAVYLGGRTLEETGEVFGIKRERVRQIVSKVLPKIKREAARRYPNGVFDTRERDADVEREFDENKKKQFSNQRSTEPHVVATAKPRLPFRPVATVLPIIISRKRRTRKTGDAVSITLTSQKQFATSPEAQRVLDAVRAAFAGRS